MVVQVTGSELSLLANLQYIHCQVEGTVATLRLPPEILLCSSIGIETPIHRKQTQHTAIKPHIGCQVAREVEEGDGDRKKNCNYLWWPQNFQHFELSWDKSQHLRSRAHRSHAGGKRHYIEQAWQTMKSH